jgi:hypothetical protein
MKGTLMNRRTARGLIVIGLVSIVGLASCIWLGRSTANHGGDQRRVTRDTWRKIQIARFAKLRSTLRYLAEKESQEEKEERRRFQSILASVLRNRSAIVVDAQKLRNSPLSDQLIACLVNTQQVKLDRARKEWGIDTLADVRRIAFAKGFVLVSGEVASAETFIAPANTRWESYGGQGKVFDTERDPGSGRPNAGLWGQKLLMISDNVDDIYDAIDITEGWEAERGGFIHSNGVIYGSMEAGELFRLLEVFAYMEPVMPLMNKLVERVKFELDVHQSVLVRTELVLYRKETKDALIIALESLRDILVKKSNAFGYDELSELIDSVAVTDLGGSAILEWEMSLAFVKRELTRCSG